MTDRNDSICLLKECNAGIKMAVKSVNDIAEYVNDNALKEILISSIKEHERLGNETHELLNNYDDTEKEPSTMAEAMSWMKTNFKMMKEQSSAQAADLVTDGCNMGIKSLYKYVNEYMNADKESVDIAHKIIEIEEELRAKMKDYL